MSYGQSSADFMGSSSSLRILHAGIFNAVAPLALDGFTQTNPPVVAGVTNHADSRSKQLSITPKYGVLSGSVSFTRPDAGNGFVGGPHTLDAAVLGEVRPLGLFVNDAAGNPWENSPGPASGQAPYMSASGTYACGLFETQDLATGDDLVYAVGQKLIASKNGYLTNNATDAFEAADVTTLGIIKIAPDSAHGELIFDLRV